MSEFNFNSQVCTDKNQSERLLALGLKKETADMCYKVATHDWRGHEIPEKDKHYSICCWYDELNIVCGFEQVKTIPAWSLHRLIEMMPNCLEMEDEEGETWEYLFHLSHVEVVYDVYLYERRFSEMANIYDNLISCIEWLIKEGYFNKEYLEE